MPESSPKTHPPSISLVKLSTKYNGVLLDKLKGNYHEWLNEIELALLFNGHHEYVLDAVPEPIPSVTPHAHDNWKANMCLANTFLTSSVDPQECKLLDLKVNTITSWKNIKERHQKEGPIQQVTLLQQVLNIHCIKESSLPEVTNKICDLVEHAWTMGNITCDLFCSITILHALGEEFQHGHTIISHDINLSTKDKPFMSKDIHCLLEDEQTL